MNDHQMKVSELLAIMLESGWEWTKSNYEGMVSLKKGCFEYCFNQFELSFQTLIDCMCSEAYERGTSDGYDLAVVDVNEDRNL